MIIQAHPDSIMDITNMATFAPTDCYACDKLVSTQYGRHDFVCNYGAELSMRLCYPCYNSIIYRDKRRKNRASIRRRARRKQEGQVSVVST
jgi:hypothetical protein